MRSLLILVSTAALVVLIYSPRPSQVAARRHSSAEASFSPRYSRSYSMELIDFSHAKLPSVSARSSWCSNSLRYQFKTIDLLKQALTHPSYSQENNRALSILGLSSAEAAASLRLLANNADASASSVSSAVAEASRLSTCATAGKRLGIGAIVRVAFRTDASTPSVICTALRAVFGSVAVDTGSVDAAVKVFLMVYKSGLGVAVLSVGPTASCKCFFVSYRALDG